MPTTTCCSSPTPRTPTRCAGVWSRLLAEDGLEITDQHRTHAVLAVQGPRSDEVLTAVGLPVGQDYMAFAVAPYDGSEVVVCRTGYTGERGYELVVENSAAPALWDAVLSAGEPFGIRPCGLGARDTLRTEMGYPLHGQDISLEVTPGPGAARLGRGLAQAGVLGPRRARGREGGRPAGAAARTSSPQGRGIARPGMTVRGSDGRARRPASPPAPSPRPCATGSRWRCSTPRSRTPPRWASTSAAGPRPSS